MKKDWKREEKYEFEIMEGKRRRGRTGRERRGEREEKERRERLEGVKKRKWKGNGR